MTGKEKGVEESLWYLRGKNNDIHSEAEEIQVRP